MRHSLRKLTAVLMIALMTSFAFLAGSALASQDWHSTVAMGERITFNYPTWLSEDDVQWLIQDREQALAFVEDFVGFEYVPRVSVYVGTSLLLGGASATPYSTGGQVFFSIPYGLDARAPRPWDGTMPGGCHEEAHLISMRMNRWTEVDAPLLSLSLLEGFATYVDAVYRNSYTYRAYAAGLLSQSKLPPLWNLFTLQMTEESPPETASVAYHGGASFFEFIDSSFGRECLLAVYSGADLDEDAFRALLETETGIGLQELNERWQHAVSDYGQDAARRGARAQTERDSEANVELAWLLWELEMLWSEGDTELIGPSLVAQTAYRDYQNAMDQLLQGQEGSTISQDVLRVQTAIADLTLLCDTWINATVDYEDVLYMPDAFEPDELQDLLDSALAGYWAAGDLTMVERVQARLDDYN